MRNPKSPWRVTGVDAPPLEKQFVIARHPDRYVYVAWLDERGRWCADLRKWENKETQNIPTPQYWMPIPPLPWGER